MTTAYRLVNGEGDRLGGLIIDVFGKRIIVQSTAIWVEIRRSLIISALKSFFHEEGDEYVILWRQAEARLKQDGFLNITSTSTTSTALSSDEVVDKANDANSNDEEDISVLENGVQFVVSTENSQKTGFFCDQRDNRRRIGELSWNKTVLDLYCYSAGFSMYAARGGALRSINIQQYSI